MHDGSTLVLRKLEASYNPTDKVESIRMLHETVRRGEFATGIVYIQPDATDFLTLLNLVDEPLATLPQAVTRPPQSVLDEIMDRHR
jgi:2-oxoglutarate ferredoxin oxidoreductase subunit beta